MKKATTAKAYGKAHSSYCSESVLIGDPKGPILNRTIIKRRVVEPFHGRFK